MATKKLNNEGGGEVERQEYILDADSDGAIEWITDDSHGIKEYNADDDKNESYRAVCIYGDRFYHSRFLPSVELEKSHLGMNGAFHDINHWGTTNPLTGKPDIGYVIGHQNGTVYNKGNKSIETNVFVKKTAPKYQEWKNFVDICKDAGRTPNVSISFWASKKQMRVKDLPKDVNYSSYGYSDDDLVDYLYDVEFRALSTVFKGACDDKAGCGIGIGIQNADTDTEKEAFIDLGKQEDDKLKLEKIKTTNLLLKRRKQE